MEDVIWILIDTETNGFKSPIYTVEIGAQKMRGWKPIGEPFRRLVNQNCSIPIEASRIHGYTREILARKGYSPETVYKEFRNYVGGDHPIASFNLSYDWDRVLVPEWKRLGIAPVGLRGVCMLRLAQRLLDPCPAGNCQLQTLRQFYDLPGGASHTALGDVQTTISLLQRILRPLAKSQELNTWDEIERFAEKKFYPSLIPFGKFKGRNFKSAIHDEELRDWLQWLATTNEGKAGMAKWYLRKLGIALESTERKTRRKSDTIRLEPDAKLEPLSRSSSPSPVHSSASGQESVDRRSQPARNDSSPKPEVERQPESSSSTEITPARNCLGGVFVIVICFLIFRGCMALAPSSPKGEPIRIKGRNYYPTPAKSSVPGKLNQPSASGDRNVKEIESQVNRQDETREAAIPDKPESIAVESIVRPAKLPTEFRLWRNNDGRQAELQAISVDSSSGTVVFRMRDGRNGKKTNIKDLIRRDQIFLLGGK